MSDDAKQLTALDPESASTLADLADRILKRRELIYALEADNDVDTTEMGELAVRIGASKIEAPSWSLMRPAGRSSLSKELLLKNGVTPHTLELSTVCGEPGRWRVVRRLQR